MANIVVHWIQPLLGKRAFHNVGVPGLTPGYSVNEHSGRQEMMAQIRGSLLPNITSERRLRKYMNMLIMSLSGGTGTMDILKSFFHAFL